MGHFREGFKAEIFRLLETVETNLLDAFVVGFVRAESGTGFGVESAPGVPSRRSIRTVLHERVIEFRFERDLFLKGDGNIIGIS